MAGAFHGVGEARRGHQRRRVAAPAWCKAAAAQECRGSHFDDGGGDHQEARPSRSPAWASSSRSEASERLGVPFGIVDLSLAPTPAVGDSVAHILEEMGLETLRRATAPPRPWRMLNDAVKKGGVMASSHVGGLSGAFIPVSARTRA